MHLHADERRCTYMQLMKTKYMRWWRATCAVGDRNGVVDPASSAVAAARNGVCACSAASRRARDDARVSRPGGDCGSSTVSGIGMKRAGVRARTRLRRRFHHPLAHHNCPWSVLRS